MIVTVNGRVEEWKTDWMRHRHKGGARDNDKVRMLKEAGLIYQVDGNIR